jgi:hypothetical protein
MSTKQTAQTTEELLAQIDWKEISDRLQAPFDPKDVDFRVQGKVNESNRGQVVAYIDARVVQDRLDTVVGAGAWSFDWTPLVIENGEVMIAKGTLTIHGVSKSDIGTASNFEQSMGTVSHSFKRAAVHWGIGRYLYSLPTAWVNVERGGRIPEQVVRELRAKLPRPLGLTKEATETESERIVETPTERRAPNSRPAMIRETSTPAAQSEAPATEQQLVSIGKLYEALHRQQGATPSTYSEARQLITQLSAEYQRMRRAS